MEAATATASGRGVRRFAAAGAAVVLSGSMLVAAGSGAGAKGNFTRDCFRGFGDRHLTHLNGPLVDLAETPSERGCWLVGADGGVFTFGDAKFYGSAAALKLVSPVVGFATTRRQRVTGCSRPTAASSTSETRVTTVLSAVRSAPTRWLRFTSHRRATATSSRTRPARCTASRPRPRRRPPMGRPRRTERPRPAGRQPTRP